MPVDLDLTLARRVVTDVCAAHHVAVVPPDHVETGYRAALVGAMAAWRGVLQRPVDLPALLRSESFAIPSLPAALATGLALPLRLVPVVGPVFADVLAVSTEERLYLAPSVYDDPALLVATVARLLTYVETWQRGTGAVFALAWLTVGEMRGMVGAQALAQAAQVRVALGADVAVAMAEARAMLNALDLDDGDRKNAAAMLDACERSLSPHEGEARTVTLDGPSITLLRSLRDAGVSLALDVA